MANARWQHKLHRITLACSGSQQASDPLPHGISLHRSLRPDLSQQTNHMRHASQNHSSQSLELHELSPQAHISRDPLTRHIQPGDPDTYAEEGGLIGWTVVVGSCTIFFVVLGLVYSFGVLQSELIHRNYATPSVLGWVSSLTVCFMSIFAIPITALIRRTSNRFVNLLGAFCTGGGYLATSYTFNKPVVFLFLAQSLFGIGYALTFWSSNSLAGQYFERKRALAVGIVYAGSGVGGAVFSIGLSRLIRRVGLELAVRIYGVIALALLIPASFTLRQKKEIPVASFKLMYLRQTNFLLLVMSTALMTFSLFVPPFYLPSYAVAGGLSAETGAWLVAGYNLASAMGRLIFGVLADGRVGPVTSLCAAMVLMTVSILAIWMASDGLLAPLVIFLLVNGAASGALLSLQPPVIASLYGVSEMSVTMAMVTMSRFAGSAFGPPIAGYLLDAFSGGNNAGTRPYLAPIGVMGAISFVAALILVVLRWRLAGIDWKKRV